MERDLRKYRDTDYPIASLFRDRWSPRALSGEPIKRDELMSLFEAARWAPSSYNNQPWRFLYALRGTSQWPRFFDLLNEFNQSWAHNAAALLVLVSRSTLQDGRPAVTHGLDAGAAWENLALQGSLKGLVVHGMQGFDYERARQELHIPEEFDLLAMVAVGRPGRKEDLPAALQEREVPSGRMPIDEFAFEGEFPE